MKTKRITLANCIETFIKTKTFNRNYDKIVVGCFYSSFHSAASSSAFSTCPNSLLKSNSLDFLSIPYNPSCGFSSLAKNASKEVRFFSSSNALKNAISANSSSNSNKSLWTWGLGSSDTHFWNRSKKTQKDVEAKAEEISCKAVPTKIEGFTNVSIEDIACGIDHAAFIVDGKLYTYGSNRYNQLGREINEKSCSSEIPGVVKFPGDVRIIGVACGGYHTAAIDQNGILYTWGWGGNFFNGAGGLGRGDRKDQKAPAVVDTFIQLGDPVIQVVCGLQHTLALTQSNKIYSTGRGEFGRLGRGNNGDQLNFEEINFFTAYDSSMKFKKIDCGASHSAALSDDGKVWVWGRNDYGQLGLDDSMGDMYSNEMYPRICHTFELEKISVADIASGDFHMLAATTDGVVYFWGARIWLAPKSVSLASSYKNSNMKHRMIKVAGGGSSQHYSMAISDEGNLYTWGKPASTCLARKVCKDANEPILIPSSVFNEEKVLGVSCGRHKVLAVTSSM